MADFKDRPVQVFMRVALCGKCSGELKYSGATLLVHPARYVHHCKVCGEEEVLDDSYPVRIYRAEEFGGPDDQNV